MCTRTSHALISCVSRASSAYDVLHKCAKSADDALVKYVTRTDEVRPPHYVLHVLPSQVFSTPLLRGSYFLVGKKFEILAYLSYFTRTPGVPTRYFTLASFLRARCVLLDAGTTQQKTSRPVFLLRAMRRLFALKITCVTLASSVLLGQFLRRRPHAGARTCGCTRAFSSFMLLVNDVSQGLPDHHEIGHSCFL